MDFNIFINFIYVVFLDELVDDSKEYRLILFFYINLLIFFCCMCV